MDKQFACPKMMLPVGVLLPYSLLAIELSEGSMIGWAHRLDEKEKIANGMLGGNL